jgi:beta-D-xylosidase 4
MQTPLLPVTPPPPPLCSALADAYSLEDSDGFDRYDFNAIVSNYALMDSFFPAFKRAVTEGGAKGVMCSYNSLNGVPTCANRTYQA